MKPGLPAYADVVCFHGQVRLHCLVRQMLSTGRRRHSAAAGETAGVGTRRRPGSIPPARRPAAVVAARWWEDAHGLFPRMRFIIAGRAGLYIVVNVRTISK